MVTPLRVLIADADPVRRESMCRALTLDVPPIQASGVSSGADCLRALQSNTWDAVLLDDDLPDAPATAMLDRLRAARITLPVLLLVGQSDAAMVIEALRRGATHCALKGEEFARLLPDAVIQAVDWHRQPRVGEPSDRQEARLIALCQSTRAACHEIDNLLLAITGTVQLLLQAKCNADVATHTHLDRIQRAGSRIYEVTERLRTLIAPIASELEGGMSVPL